MYLCVQCPTARYVMLHVVVSVVSGHAGYEAVRLRAGIQASGAFKGTASLQQHGAEWSPTGTGVACCTDSMEVFSYIVH